MPETISLGSLLTRGVELRAEEAVAVALQLIDLPPEACDTQPPLGPPSLESVQLTDTGGLVCRGCAMTPSVFEVGLLLDAMLKGSSPRSVPGGLRYLIARTLLEVDAPPIDSLAQLSASLARHAKSQPSVVLRTLWERATEQTPAAVAPALVGVDRRRTLPANAEWRRQLREWDRSRYEAQAAAQDMFPPTPFLHVPLPEVPLIKTPTVRVMPLRPAGKRRKGSPVALALASAALIVMSAGSGYLATARHFGLRRKPAAASNQPSAASTVRRTTAPDVAKSKAPTTSAVVTATQPSAALSPLDSTAIAPLSASGARSSASVPPPSASIARKSAEQLTDTAVESTRAADAASTMAHQPAPEDHDVRSAQPAVANASLADPVRATSPAEGPAFSPAFGASGTALFFHSGRSRDARSALKETDGLGDDFAVMTIVDDGAKNYHVEPSPDGNRVAFDSDRDGVRGVYIADRNGSNVQRISGAGYAAVPKWSPDGDRLTFVRAEDHAPNVWNLWLLSLATGQAQRITQFNFGQTWGGSWFPDGQRIAFTHEDRLFVRELNTGNTRQFVSPVRGHIVRTPAVSPDGRYIVFQVYKDGAWMLDLRDGSMRSILNDPTAEEFAWSPDGRRVAFHSRRDGDWGIWIMSGESAGTK